MTDSGSAYDLRDGEHGCLTFSDTDEWLGILSGFIGSSLERGHKVLCVTDKLAPQTLLAEFAERGLDVGSDRRLMIHPTRQSSQGTTSGDELLDLVAEQMAVARSEGFRGLWLSMDLQWAARQGTDVAVVTGFEKALGALAANPSSNLTALCHYERRTFTSDTLDVAAGAHSPSLAAATYHHDAMLQISRPAGTTTLRIAGELDFARLDPLVTALDETLRIDREVHLELRHLRFVDVPTAYAIIAAAARMTVDQRMIISGGQRITDMLARLGLTELHRVRTRVSHERR
jgi:hypothetical protein